MKMRMSGKRESRNTEGPQLDVRIIRTNKVFKTTKGGKTASWSILVVVGDNKGSVGVGLGKARGIPDAIRKAEEAARKSMFLVPMIGSTIPHEIRATAGTAQVMLRPAAAGTGVGDHPLAPKPRSGYPGLRQPGSAALLAERGFGPRRLRPCRLHQPTGRP